MILENSEPLIRLFAVPQIAWLPLRRGGAKLNQATVFRWAKHGCRGVRLETVNAGGAQCTSEAAVKRFFEKLGERADPVQKGPSPSQRRKSIERAQRELKALGLC